MPRDSADAGSPNWTLKIDWDKVIVWAFILNAVGGFAFLLLVAVPAEHEREAAAREFMHQCVVVQNELESVCEARWRWRKP